jgi:hypothetical protein
MAAQCNLTNWECDELEFEGSTGPMPAAVNTEVILAVCLGLAGLLLAWNLGLRGSQSFGGRRCGSSSLFRVLAVPSQKLPIC